MVNPEWSRVYIFRPILPRDAVVVKVRCSRNKPERPYTICVT